MKQPILFFFRNDDVRNTLDESLVKLTEVFIKHNIPISHAVEPANVTKEVIDWLLNIKDKHPHLLEIIQHGYNHKLNYREVIGGRVRKGEFGGNRTYREQYDDMQKGQELMNKYFGNRWFNAFTFPFGARNQEAIRALDDLKYNVVNGGISINLKNRIFYSVGRTLQKEMLFGRKISWNLRTKPGTNIFQIDMGISVIKKYIDSETGCEFFSDDELNDLTHRYISSEKIVGILFHHRYHNDQLKIDYVDRYLGWLRTLPDIEFVTQEKIYQVFKAK